MLPRFRGCEANGAAEWFDRHAAAGTIHRRRHRGRIIFPELKVRLFELIREKTEARNITCPPPSGCRKLEHRDFDGVARLGALDKDGTGYGIDLLEVEMAKIRGLGSEGELPA